MRVWLSTCVYTVLVFHASISALEALYKYFFSQLIGPLPLQVICEFEVSVVATVCYLPKLKQALMLFVSILFSVVFALELFRVKLREVVEAATCGRGN